MSYKGKDENDFRQHKQQDLGVIHNANIVMVCANSVIEVYKGPFLLKAGNEELIISGEMEFRWLPDLNVYLSGIGHFSIGEGLKLSDMKLPFDVIIDGIYAGQCFVTNASWGNSNVAEIKAVMTQEIVVGDKTVPVDKLIFSIPNMRDFRGNNLITKDGETIEHSVTRIFLEYEEYTIIITKIYNYEHSQKSLESDGGYIIQYSGNLTCKKGPILYNRVLEALNCTSEFLSFINGRRTAILFLFGVYGTELKWSDYSSYEVDPFRLVKSWAPKNLTHELNFIWEKFVNLWKDKNDKDFLTTSIHWYLQAKSSYTYAEDAIILAQTALELIYNWLIVENKGIIVGKDSESISASNKMRLLLSHINVNYNCPKGFKELTAFIMSNKDVIDAPEAIVQIRNAIVHSQFEKRKRLSSISPKTIAEARQLCISYIELSLLYVFNYKGSYVDRCEIKFAAINKAVPWIK